MGNQAVADVIFCPGARIPDLYNNHSKDPYVPSDNFLLLGRGILIPIHGT